MIQPQQLQLPTQRDPLARLALVALVACACWIALNAPSASVSAETVLIATPTIGIVPTEAPTEAPVPTAVPVAVQAAPTQAPPPTPEPVIVERQVIVEVTAVPPPEPTQEPAPTALPAGTLIILPTPTQSNEDFVASFGPTPDPNAKCAFVGCLHQP